VGSLTRALRIPARAAARRARPEARGARAPHAGFTLIELLVALLVAAVLIGMVTVSGSPSPERALRFDADRLAQLLSLAREEAQVRSAPIRFDSDAEGYRFLIFRDRQWRILSDDGDLRPRAWDVPTRVLVDRADGRRTLDFGRDLVEPPYRVRLQREGASVTILANGLGSFEVLE
jgi:general secretion pathway protein H